MSRQAHGRACLLALALCLALPVHAAGPAAVEPVAVEPAAATAIDADLVGHYSLSGVMETGSELLLQPDGRFQWYLAYGALDLTAEGRWSREGTHVLLDPDKTDGPAQVPEPRFQRMRLRVDGQDLVPAWPWEDGAERGRYSRE